MLIIRREKFEKKLRYLNLRSVFGNKIGGGEVAVAVFGVAGAERHVDKAAQLEVEVGPVAAVGSTDGADLVAAAQQISGLDLDVVEVGVDGERRG